MGSITDGGTAQLVCDHYSQPSLFCLFFAVLRCKQLSDPVLVSRLCACNLLMCAVAVSPFLWCHLNVGLANHAAMTGGYAFAGNGLWFLAMLAPVPRYQPQLARALAKWVYNLASAMRYFLGDSAAVKDQQSNPLDKWDRGNSVMYEGLRKCDFNRTFGSVTSNGRSPIRSDVPACDLRDGV